MNIVVEIFLPLIIAFIMAYFLGKFLIPLLTEMKYGQNIREEGPKAHKVKQGTPTIGGLIFIISTTVVSIFYSLIVYKSLKSEMMLVLLIFLSFGYVGFLDDYLKIKRKNNLGLRAYQKMALLIVISFVIYLLTRNTYLTNIYIPFLKIKVDLGILYLPFVFLYFTGVTNAVNLTDGLDGLATTVSIIVLIFLFLVSFVFGRVQLGIFSFILVGSLMAFLMFNLNPAKVFMGDTGSLALGGAIACVAFLLGIEIVLIIAGIIYVIEALSVIIQVVVYKLTKKRVFKMAPIHHHFEHLGWSENKVVYIFGLITIIGCIISFLLL